MRRQLRGKGVSILAIAGLIALATLIGGYIVGQERLRFPSWVPFAGSSSFTLKGAFETAQAVAPGQGQAVTVAGAKVGEIARVELHGGRAIVTLRIEPRYARIHSDATMLLRPRTALKDETVELNRGSAAAPLLRSGALLPISQTAPDVNLDEVLASLDGDTQAYLQALAGGLGEGLRGQGRALSAGLRRFDPTAVLLGRATRLLAQRHSSLARVVHDFQLLASAVGQKDHQLADLVRSSNTVFAALAREQHNLRSAVALLPGALGRTRTALDRLSGTARQLGPTLASLQPAARALAPGLRASRPFLRQTKPIIAAQLRPFARAALPTAAALAPASTSLARATPPLAASAGVLNDFLNELAYNPGTSRGGFLFFLAWANHNLNTILSTQDAHGALRRGLVLFSCSSLTVLNGAAQVNPTVDLLLGLLNPPPTSQICGGGA